jgi:hypothetical protein
VHTSSQISFTTGISSALQEQRPNVVRRTKAFENVGLYGYDGEEESAGWRSVFLVEVGFLSRRRRTISMK